MGSRPFFSGQRKSDPSNEDLFDRSWRLGDLAECVATGEWRQLSDGSCLPGPVFQEIRVVTHVELETWSMRVSIIWLFFARWPSQQFDARCFRKIVPAADIAEKADAEFLRSLKPVRVLEPASGASC